MEQEKQRWINKVLFEHELDMNFNTSWGGPPARLDLKSINKQLWSIHKEECVRSNGVYYLFKKAYEISQKQDFEIVITVEDVPRDKFTKPHFCFSTMNNFDYENVVPDYSFYSLALKGRYGYNGHIKDDYDSLVNAVISAGEKPPQTYKAGWCGHAGTSARQYFVKQCNQHPLSNFCEVIDINWTKPNQDSTWPDKFMTFDEQVKRWRYLIDISGLGWADRTKFFFFSNRVVFYIKRKNNEFYFKNMEPWKHYVPVEPDLSDLENNFKIIKNDEKLENYIKKNALEFAKENLTQQKAIEFYCNLIDNTNWSQKNTSISLPLTKNKFQEIANRPLPGHLNFNVF